MFNRCNPLHARVATKRHASGLFSVAVDNGYMVRTYRGFMSDTAARLAGCRAAESVGRVPFVIS